MIGTRRKSHLGNTVAHIFQRARSGFVVFYNVKDSLFFITLLFVTARQHGIKVLGMCLMYNHIHMLNELRATACMSAVKWAFSGIFDVQELHRMALPDITPSDNFGKILGQIWQRQP